MSDTQIQLKHWTEYKDFYDNEFIKKITDLPLWTVSINKVPMDIHMYNVYKQFQGASYDKAGSLITLTKLINCFPYAINNTFYLNSQRDKYYILDIEPSCPDDIKNELLKTNWIYGERSMSKKGYHLVYPLPDYIKDYPIAEKKIALREEHGYYEILFNHYITFTRDMIEKPNETNDIEPIFRNLCKIQKERNIDKIDIDLICEKNIPHKEKILTLLDYYKYKKTPKDYNDDMSRYEFGFASSHLHKLMELTKKFPDYNYSNEEILYLLYYTLVNKLEHREKHDELRNDKPWLVECVCIPVISSYLTQEEEKAKKQINKDEKR